MINAINSLNAQNIPQFSAIQSATSTPNERTSPSSSQRASMRRMRMETPAARPEFVSESLSIDDPLELVQKYKTQMEKAIKDGRYSEALSFLDKIESLVGGSFAEEFIEEVEKQLFINGDDLRSAFEHVRNGVISAYRAYLFALSGNESAISLCDSGFENLKLGMDEVIEMMKDLGMPDSPELKEFPKQLEVGHLYVRGMIAMRLSMRQAAIDDLRESFRLGLEVNDPAPVDMLFLGKVLERKLDTPLFPESSDVDPQDPKALLMAGRYEEALELSSTPDAIRAACLALMGRYDEALETLDNTEFRFINSDLDGSYGKALVYLLKGDHEMAKKMALSPMNDDELSGHLLLLALPNAVGHVS
jgi:tetratricopeptide (TPR) repeat protein